jgi:hypothetical protein
MSIIQAPNGAIYTIPDESGARATYLRNLLDSLITPYSSVSGTVDGLANNFIAGTDPLSGAQQSSILGLDVVMQSPEQIDMIATRLADDTGGNKIDWIAILTGLYDTAKRGNIPGVSDELKKFETQSTGIVAQVAVDSLSNKIAKFISQNFLLVLGGVILLIGFIFYSFGKK